MCNSKRVRAKHPPARTYASWLFNNTAIGLGISGEQRGMPIITQVLSQKLDTLADELPALLGKPLPFVYLDANKTSPFVLLGIDPERRKESTGEAAGKMDERPRAKKQVK